MHGSLWMRDAYCACKSTFKNGRILSLFFQVWDASVVHNPVRAQTARVARPPSRSYSPVAEKCVSDWASGWEMREARRAKNNGERWGDQGTDANAISTCFIDAVVSYTNVNGSKETGQAKNNWEGDGAVMVKVTQRNRQTLTFELSNSCHRINRHMKVFVIPYVIRLFPSFRLRPVA